MATRVFACLAYGWALGAHRRCCCRVDWIGAVAVAGPAEHVRIQGMGRKRRTCGCWATTICRRAAAYQPVIHQQGTRWIAYIGHHGGEAMNPLTGMEEGNGTSIVDVTDPANPKYLFTFRASKEWAKRAARRWCGYATARICPKGDAAKFYLLRTLGNSAHEIWDVTMPERPALLPR